MSAPWDITSGFWKRSLSDPYYRMMNISGTSFRDHAGSMVRGNHTCIVTTDGMNNYYRIYVKPLCGSASIVCEKVAHLSANSIKGPKIKASSVD